MDLYKSAKLEKLKQLKKIMYELMAGEGMGMDETIPKEGMAAAMEAAEGEVNGTDDLEAIDDEAGEDPLEELREMQREYFAPKMSERRPGTAILFGSVKTKKEPMDDKPKIAVSAKTGPMKKKGKY